MLVSVAGCADSKPPTRDVEKTVRSVIAEHMKVKPESIDMKTPLSDPPLKCDELDIVEMVMTLEERLGVEIPDSAFEKYGGLATNEGPARITPGDLVAIAKNALANPTPRRKK